VRAYEDFYQYDGFCVIALRRVRPEYGLSSTTKGAARVGAVLTALSRHGYRCARVASSGQRKGARRVELGIAGDVIALAPLDAGVPHIICEVGGVKKSVRAALAEMTTLPMPPGFVAIVVRCVDRRWRWHIGDDQTESFPTLGDALDALRSGAAS